MNQCEFGRLIKTCYIRLVMTMIKRIFNQSNLTKQNKYFFFFHVTDVIRLVKTCMMFS